MTTLAHIINVFQPSEASDLHLAQEVTIQSMIRAKQQVEGNFQVELLTAQTNEDRVVVPTEFRATSDLNRDVTTLQLFNKPMKLPILKDILDRLYNESSAEYLIFTNVDIGLQPNFYQAVVDFINAGHDAFMINRRRIPATFSSVEEIELMYNEKGKKHPGFDCFVFHRDLYPKFSLAEVCIGVPFVEITLSQNLFCFAKNPHVFTDQHLTFHIGMEIFNKRAPKEYLNCNRKQFWEAMEAIWPALDSRKWPYGKSFFPIRFIRWGLHPCYPIRLAMQLEWRRWFSKQKRG